MRGAQWSSWLVAAGILAWLGAAPAGVCQGPAGDLRAQVDAVISEAYRVAAEGFPCKPKTRGKPRMLRWEDVDRCLNGAAGRVDWDQVSSHLRDLQAATAKAPAGQLAAAVESAFDAHAWAFDMVFSVKNTEVLLPLTNSLLKYLPADSLHDLPVIDKTGNEVGKFAGTYAYERTGGLSSANTYRLVLFQYQDRGGAIQTATGKLLLDSFGVPWKDAMKQRGFRLPSDKLDLAR